MRLRRFDGMKAVSGCAARELSSATRVQVSSVSKSKTLCYDRVRRCSGRSAKKLPEPVNISPGTGQPAAGRQHDVLRGVPFVGLCKRPSEAWHQVHRALEHGSVKSACRNKDAMQKFDLQYMMASRALAFAFDQRCPVRSKILGRTLGIPDSWPPHPCSCTRVQLSTVHASIDLPFRPPSAGIQKNLAIFVDKKWSKE